MGSLDKLNALAGAINEKDADVGRAYLQPQDLIENVATDSPIVFSAGCSRLTNPSASKVSLLELPARPVINALR